NLFSRRFLVDSCDSLFGIGGEFSLGKDLQIRLVVVARFIGLIFLFQYFAQAESRHCVIGLVGQRFAKTALCGSQVLPLQIELADFNVLFRFVRIPWMHLSHIAGGRVFAVRMVLCVVLWRGKIDPRIVTGTFVGSFGGRGLRYVVDGGRPTCIGAGQRGGGWRLGIRSSALAGI